MDEVNHRSKNMLSLVQTIAQQTAAPSFEEFLARFEERIHALAANQDLLVKNNWTGADLSELVGEQLSHFKDLFGTRIVFDGPAVFLSAPAAQAIGMAMHELATNAAKYGALKRPEGKIAISWNLSTPEDRFVMEWRESCAGSIQPPVKRGFGSAVISSVVEMGLDAKVDLSFPDTGLVWRVDCPLDRIVE
jgi:two-component sensor histidine kinase